MRVIIMLVIGTSGALGFGLAPAGADESCALAPLVCPTAPTPPTTPPTPAPPAPAPSSPQPGPEPAPSPQPSPEPAPRAAADEPATAQALFDLVNRTRADQGLGSLVAHPAAQAIAVQHSLEMAARHDIFHNDELFTAATKARLGARSVGENVALNDTAQGAHDRLMASEGHRANILTARFRAAGIGTVRGDDGRLYVTEVFLEPLETGAPAASPAGIVPPVNASSHRARTTPSVSAEVQATDAAPAEPAASEGDDVAIELASGRQLVARLRPSHGLAPTAPIVAALALLAAVAAGAAATRRRLDAASVPVRTCR